MERDFFMAAEESKAYGLIDQVLEQARRADAPTGSARRRAACSNNARSGPFSRRRPRFLFDYH